MNEIPPRAWPTKTNQTQRTTLYSAYSPDIDADVDFESTHLYEGLS